MSETLELIWKYVCAVECLRVVCEHSVAADEESRKRLERGMVLAMRLNHRHGAMFPDFEKMRFWEDVGRFWEDQEVGVCECRDWARDGRSSRSVHHPRCGLYVGALPDLRFAVFGEAMWRFIERQGGEFCGEEISEDVLPLAEKAGLCRKVAYDPALHGEGIEAEPGATIWFWGSHGGHGGRGGVNAEVF